MESYLKKKSTGVMSSFKKSYFKMQGLQLNYADTDIELTPRGVIFMNKCVKVAPGDKDGVRDVDNLDFTIFLPDRAYEMQALTLKDARAWINVLSVFDSFATTYEVPSVINTGLTACFNHLDRNGANAKGCFKEIGSRAQIKRLVNDITVSNRDYLEDLIDAVNVSQVCKLLIAGLPESMLSNPLVLPITDECNRLVKLPAGTIDLNLDDLIGHLKKIRMPYISYLTRLVKICQSLLNNSNITKLDVKTLASSLAPVLADTSILEPELNPPPNMENVISIFTIFYDLLFVPIMQQINAELQAASQAANILKRQESIRPGLHRINTLSLNGQQGENLAAMTMSAKGGPESIRPGMHRRNSLSLNGQQGENLAAMTMSIRGGLDKSPMNQALSPRSRGSARNATFSYSDSIPENPPPPSINVTDSGIPIPVTMPKLGRSPTTTLNLKPEFVTEERVTPLQSPENRRGSVSFNLSTNGASTAPSSARSINSAVEDTVDDSSVKSAPVTPSRSRKSSLNVQQRPLVSREDKNNRTSFRICIIS